MHMNVLDKEKEGGREQTQREPKRCDLKPGSDANTIAIPVMHK